MWTVNKCRPYDTWYTTAERAVTDRFEYIFRHSDFPNRDIIRDKYK